MSEQRDPERYAELLLLLDGAAAARGVLEGILEDDSWFAYVCQLDPCPKCEAEGKIQPTDNCPDCDDWKDERVWEKANPGLRNRVRFELGIAEDLPLPDAGTDLIWCRETLYHVEALETAFAECRRVLRRLPLHRMCDGRLAAPRAPRGPAGHAGRRRVSRPPRSGRRLLRCVARPRRSDR